MLTNGVEEAEKSEKAFMPTGNRRPSRVGASHLARLLGVPTKGQAFELDSLHQSRVCDYQR